MHRLVCCVAVSSMLQSAAPVVRAQDAEQHVFVTVLDDTGAPVTGLTAAHFAIREGGKDRAVVRVEPLLVPMHVAVLVDTSAVNVSDEAFKSAVLTFIERLAATNEVAVYSIGDRPTQVASFTRDAARLRTAVTGMFGWGHSRSALIDGIETALRDLERTESKRPVIIAISSEAPEASGRSAGAVIKKMIGQSTAFHSVWLASISPGGASPVRRSRADPSGMDIAASSQALQGMTAAGEGDRERNQVFDQGTAMTGGSRQRITSTMALGQALHRLGTELANGYRVTFTRPGSGKLEGLQVGLMAEGLTVRATPGPLGAW